MRHLLLAALIAGTATAPLQAQQVATVVVQPDSLPGPQLIARNDEAPLQLRGLRDGSSLMLDVVVRDPQSCLRGVAVALAGGPALVVEQGTASSWLPSLSVAGVGSGRAGSASTLANTPPGPPQNQSPNPPPTTPAPQSSSRRSSLGFGVALGTALFDRLRERCESALQFKIGLPAEVDMSRLLIDVQLTPRGAPSSAPPAIFSFGLRLAGGTLLGTAPPRLASP